MDVCHPELITNLWVFYKIGQTICFHRFICKAICCQSWDSKEGGEEENESVQARPRAFVQWDLPIQPESLRPLAPGTLLAFFLDATTSYFVDLLYLHLKFIFIHSPASNIYNVFRNILSILLTILLISARHLTNSSNFVCRKPCSHHFHALLLEHKWIFQVILWVGRF